MKKNVSSVFFSTRTGSGVSACPLAVPLLALSALVLAAPPSHAASVVQFPVSTCTVTEGIGHLEIAVQRQNDLDAAVSVVVATAPLTATPGVDYTPMATDLTFLAGETNRTLPVPILEHGIVGTSKRSRCC